ncbi:U3 small nucleolar RNA-associated protein 6 [Nematocida homosporus]|uniref:U3 small nucleolar RNA-associated protein 6 n=1 Tax=Nematocida homosporus TaxID=1912981 RepID=UPI00221EFEFE|nr:U3 small nucleolar RNA-associated protein 6 [Nematocida homosporus]KAI5185119.1 U3 small nucleolar RNA-associated protein 6 [Nematocida homosporus]
MANIGLRDKLEAIVPELHYYQKRRIFKPNEIESIVNQRKAFELNLINNSSLHAYLKYIEYEVLLERIYQKRVARKNNPRDYISKRVDKLFTRAERKYPNDISLPISHLDYLISVDQRDKALQLALALPTRHAGSPTIWIHSAKQLRKLGEVDASRILFQKALRLITDKEEIINSFIEMEHLDTQSDSPQIIAILEQQLTTNK